MKKTFHLPKHTKYSKEGISCLLYVNNIKLWTEREPGTDSLIYKDNIKMSYKQQSKHQISGTATLTISCFFIRISRPDCHDILIFLGFWTSASNYSGLLYKRGIVPFWNSAFAFLLSWKLHNKCKTGWFRSSWLRLGEDSSELCCGEIVVVPQHHLWIVGKDADIKQLFL